MPKWIMLELHFVNDETRWRWRLLDAYAEELARGYAKNVVSATENALELAGLCWPGATVEELPHAH